jgi:hypothetical protein
MFVSIMAMYLPDSASGVVAAKEVFRLIAQSSKIDAVEPDGEVRSLGDGSICLKEAYLLALGGLIKMIKWRSAQLFLNYWGLQVEV